ncbi:MAG TPA: hypothetical protein VH682_17900 [Gemmataceae bacterium]|jgi:hypothetical protein
MFRFAKWLSCAALLAGAFLIGAPQTAHATLTLEIYEDIGGTIKNVTSSAMIGPPTTNGGITTMSFMLSDANFQFSGGFAETNNPGDPLTNSNITLNNTTLKYFGTASSGSLIFAVSDTGFQFNSGTPTNLSSSATLNVTGGSPSSPVTDNLTFQSYADANNNLFGVTTSGISTDYSGLQGGLVSSSGAFSTGEQNLSATAKGLTGTDASTLVTSGNLGVPFSLTSVAVLTLENGATATITGTNAVAVPEPASMMAAFTALPFLGLSAWLRRRKQAV